jgi:hypothetical protein
METVTAMNLSSMPSLNHIAQAMWRNDDGRNADQDTNARIMMTGKS